MKDCLVVACGKRPVSIKRIEKLVDDIERHLGKHNTREVSSKEIGELVMKGLHSLDEIAYVRFASVYRQFRDVGQFIKEMKKFLKGQKPATMKNLPRVLSTAA